MIKYRCLVATRKIDVEDDRMETDARSDISSVDPGLHPETLRGLSFGKAPIFVQ